MILLETARNFCKKLIGALIAQSTLPKEFILKLSAITLSIEATRVPKIETTDDQEHKWIIEFYRIVLRIFDRGFHN